MFLFICHRQTVRKTDSQRQTDDSMTPMADPTEHSSKIAKNDRLEGSFKAITADW